MKELKDFPGYFITEDGKVFSAWKRKSLGGRNGSKTYLDYNNLIELKPSFTFDGYLRVNLNSESKRITKRVHRLVAETYIENPNNLPQVNHINENKTNNYISNLEWCDNQYNAEYSKCRCKWIIENLITNETVEIINLDKFAKENNLHRRNLMRTLNGENYYKNFRIISKTQFK
jgi:hypothetical protein